VRVPIRAVIFDLWGTLLADDLPAIERRGDVRARTAAETLRRLGFDYEERHVRKAFRAAANEHSRIHGEGRDISAPERTFLYLRHLDDALPTLLDDGGLEMMHTAILTTAAKSSRPRTMDGATEALEAIRARGLLIGLVSNAGVTPGFVLREIMSSLGLLDYFGHTVFSDEVGLAKPSPEIFEHALDGLGVGPNEAAFVGDQPILDVLGARSAGLWSIQYGALREDGIEPHARIDTLRVLAAAVDSLGAVA
jgi:putative hydrolase of the HAD superfamily